MRLGTVSFSSMVPRGVKGWKSTRGTKDAAPKTESGDKVRFRSI